MLGSVGPCWLFVITGDRRLLPASHADRSSARGLRRLRAGGLGKQINWKTLRTGSCVRHACMIAMILFGARSCYSHADPVTQNWSPGSGLPCAMVILTISCSATCAALHDSRIWYSRSIVLP